MFTLLSVAVIIAGGMIFFKLASGVADAHRLGDLRLVRAGGWDSVSGSWKSGPLN